MSLSAEHLLYECRNFFAGSSDFNYKWGRIVIDKPDDKEGEG